MWTKLELEMIFETPLCGGVPRQDDLVQKWVELRQPTEAAQRQASEQGIGPDNRKPQALTAVAEERVATIDPLPEPRDEGMDKVWVGFSRNDAGLFVRGASIRAHLKDCASVVGQELKGIGKKTLFGLQEIRNFRSKVVNRLYVLEDQVNLETHDGDGKWRPAIEVTGHRDATMNVMTAMGPRTCLKRVDMVTPCRLRCTLQMLGGKEVNRDVLVALLQYGRVHGFNQDRSLGFGRYSYTLGE